MKKILKLLTCFILMISLVAGLAITPSANYESPRVVKGTEGTPMSSKNEGSAFLEVTETLYTNRFAETDEITYTWVYDYSNEPEGNGLAYDTSRFYLSGSNFGKGSDSDGLMLILSEKDSWPENVKNRTKYTLTKKKVTLTYTLSQEEIQWMNTNFPINSQLAPFQLRPIGALQKLPNNIEAQYCTRNYKFIVTKNGQVLSEYSKDGYRTYLVDKKTVEINEEVAPVASDGTVGTYNSDPSKTTYLDDGQEAMVKLTLTRPVGVEKSGDNEVNIKVPDGMTYVAGSMTATSSSGLTVNKTDSATSPKFSFTGLPVGENVVVTYKLKAGTGDTPVKYNTSNTLTNLKQKSLTASLNNDYETGAIYSEDEYNTTTTMPLQLNGKYKITFDSKGGNYTPADQAVKGGELSTKPADPTKDDNKFGKVVFDNWYYKDADGNEKVFDFTTAIRSDYNLYAKYKEPNLKVTITSDGKTFKPGQEVKYNVTVSNIGTSISKPGEVTFNIPEGMTVKDLDGGTLSEDGKSIVYKFDGIDASSNTKFHPVLVVPTTAKDGDKFNASASITSIDGTDIEDDVSTDTISSNITSSVTVETKTPKQTTVQTGDNIMISSLLIMMILSVVGIYTFKKKLD